MIKNLIIPEILHGKRLDQAVASMLPEFSRSTIQEWIAQNHITLNDVPVKSKTLVKTDDRITVSVQTRASMQQEAQAIDLNIIFEDDALLVIDKPVGLVVHPGAGNQNGTLLNALLHHAPALRTLPRAGIVHRLDKNTSGLLIIAKTEEALKGLQHQLKKRSMGREYLAIVQGPMISGGTVDAPIDRHPTERLKMAVRSDGKPSVTHYRIYKRYRAHTALTVRLETGRTHQIRVHMQHIRHPIVGDTTYHRVMKISQPLSADLRTALRTLKRQALHAITLHIEHPTQHIPMTFQSPVPHDIQHLLDALDKDLKESGTHK